MAEDDIPFNDDATDDKNTTSPDIQRILDEPYLSDRRIVSNDPFALLVWKDEPLAVDGGYWWPERLLPPRAIKVWGTMLPFVPYQPKAASPFLLDIDRPTVWREAASRRRVKNRPLFVGPGGEHVLVRRNFACMLDDVDVPIGCYRRARPGGEGFSWAWRRERWWPSVCMWLPDICKEEFEAECAAARLKRHNGG